VIPQGLMTKNNKQKTHNAVLMEIEVDDNEEKNCFNDINWLF
jgi:hypothetical protein